MLLRARGGDGERARGEGGEGLRAPRSAQPLTGSASSRRCAAALITGGGGTVHADTSVRLFSEGHYRFSRRLLGAGGTSSVAVDPQPETSYGKTRSTSRSTISLFRCWCLCTKSRRLNVGHVPETSAAVSSGHF